MGIKDLAQTAMAPAQWLALLTAPQSINLPIIEVQRGIILSHLSSEDRKASSVSLHGHLGVAAVSILPLSYLIRGSQSTGCRVEHIFRAVSQGGVLGSTSLKAVLILTVRPQTHLRSPERGVCPQTAPGRLSPEEDGFPRPLQ